MTVKIYKYVFIKDKNMFILFKLPFLTLNSMLLAFIFILTCAFCSSQRITKQNNDSILNQYTECEMNPIFMKVEPPYYEEQREEVTKNYEAIQSNIIEENISPETHEWLYSLENNFELYFNSDLKIVKNLLNELGVTLENKNIYSFKAFEKFVLDMENHHINMHNFFFNEKYINFQKFVFSKNIVVGFDKEEKIYNAMLINIAFHYKFFMNTDVVIFIKDYVGYNNFFSNTEWKESNFSMLLKREMSRKIKLLCTAIVQYSFSSKNDQFIQIVDKNCKILNNNMHYFNYLYSKKIEQAKYNSFLDLYNEFSPDNTSDYCNNEKGIRKESICKNHKQFLSVNVNFNEYFSPKLDLGIKHIIFDWSEKYPAEKAFNKSIQKDPIVCFQSIADSIQKILSDVEIFKKNPAVLILVFMSKIEIIQYTIEIAIVKLIFGVKYIMYDYHKMSLLDHRYIDVDFDFEDTNSVCFSAVKIFDLRLLHTIYDLFIGALKITRLYNFKVISKILEENIKEVYSSIEFIRCTSEPFAVSDK